jgi:hypothetical protein
LTSEHLKSNGTSIKSEHVYVTSGVETVERSEIGSMLYVRQPRTDFEQAVLFRNICCCVKLSSCCTALIASCVFRQVQECVSHPSLLAIYSEYAVEAFHVENVRFLEETHQFFKMVESYTDMVDLCVKATQILAQFVSNTAAFQVNLPAKLRLGVEKNLDVMMKMLTPVPDDPREENPVKREELRTRRASSGEHTFLRLAAIRCNWNVCFDPLVDCCDQRRQWLTMARWTRWWSRLPRRISKCAVCWQATPGQGSAPLGTTRATCRRRRRCGTKQHG